MDAYIRWIIGVKGFFYVEINEDYEVDLGKSLEKLRNLSAAHKVFVERCEPNSCILKEEAFVSDAPQVFDGLSQPVLSKNPDKITEDNQDNKGLISDLDNDDEIGDDDKMSVSDSCILQERDAVSGVEQVFDEIPEPNTSLNQAQMWTINGNNSHNLLIADSSAAPCTKLVENEVLPTLKFSTPNELLSVHNMFDRLPAPTFIKEAAKTAELDTSEGDYEPALDVAHDLDKKSVQLPSCGVQVWRSRVRLKTNFSYLRNLNGWQYFAKVHHHKDSLLIWNLYIERKHSHMPSEPFYVLNAFHFSKRRLLLYDSGSVMTLVLPMVLRVQACNTRVFESKFGWRAFLTFKELYSWGIQPLDSYWPCLKLSIGGQIFLLRLHVGCNQIYCMSSYILIYDPGDLVFGSIKRNNRPWFSTLEDKGVFRGEEDTNGSRTNICFVPLSCIFDPGGFAFWVGQISMVMLDDWFVKLLLWTNFNAITMRKSVLLYTRVSYPGGLYCQCNLRGVHLHDSWFYSAPSLGSTGSSVWHSVIYVLHELFGFIAWLLLLLNISHVGTRVMILTLNLNHSLKNSGSFEEVRRDSSLTRWRKTMGTVQWGKNYRTTSCHILIHMTVKSFIFDPGGVNGNPLAETLKARLLKHIDTLEPKKPDSKRMKPLQKLVSGKYLGLETVWVFDPSGNENFCPGKSKLKMRNRPEAYQFTGCKRLKHMSYEDFQVYVFDPGGPLTRLVTKTWNVL